MKLLQLPAAELRRKLADDGVWLRTGPFSLKIQSRIASVAEALAKLYGQFEVRTAHENFADFSVSVNPTRGLLRWLRPQVEFTFNGMQPINPLPCGQAFSMLEWGLNWCVSTQVHQYLIIRAAVVEKNGLAAILSVPTGSGKSTLTAGLILSGWRLLSGEFALIDRNTGMIQALPRPICLKNHSVSVIQQFCPDAYINHASHDAINGTVAHMRPPRDSVRRQHETARPGWLIFPTWEVDAATQLTPCSQAQAFMFLTENTFNFSQLSEEDALTVTALVDHSSCYDLRYGKLEEAIATFEQLAGGASSDSTRLECRD